MYLPPEFIQFCIFAAIIASLLGLISSRTRISRAELIGCWEPVLETDQIVINQLEGKRAAKLCLYDNDQMLMETYIFDPSGGDDLKQQCFEGVWNYQFPYILCRNLPGVDVTGIQLRIKIHQLDEGELILSSGNNKQRWKRCDERQIEHFTKTVQSIE